MRKIDYPLALCVVSVGTAVASEYITAWGPLIVANKHWPDAGEWAAIGTMLLASFALAQWHYSIRTARRQLRAYLSISSGRIKFSNLLTFVCEAKLKNCGQTPAYNMAERYEIVIAKFPGPAFKDLPVLGDENQYRACLGPGEDSGLLEVMELTEDELRGIQAEELTIWFFGEVTYRDAFGKKHFVKFKTYAAKDDLADTSDDRMNISEEGNEQS